MVAKWIIPFVLSSLALLSVLVGCTRDGERMPNNGANASAPDQVEPAPETQPEVNKPNGVDWQNWMEDRPFRSAMRYMWIDCGVMLGNSYHPEIADLELLRYSAENLARRAEQFAGHFRALRDTNRDSAISARAGDWDKAREQNDAAHRSCGGCHFDFWPLEAREFIADTLRGWHESQNVFGDEPWGKQVFTAPAPVRLSMITMRDNMQKAGSAVEARDLDKMLEATQVLHSFADKQLTIWEGVQRQAEAIAELAQENKLDGVGDHYIKLTGYCRSCHKSSSDGRGIDPLPWKQE